MPRTKTEIATEETKKRSPRSKPAAKAAKEKRKVEPKKKTKSVIIDVIEDSPAEENDFFASLPQPEEVNDNIIPAPRAAEEIDQQKKFFAELKSQKKASLDGRQKEAGGEGGRSRRKSLSLYRHLVWKFVILVAILAAAVFYFSFSKLTIVVTPKGEALSDTVFLKVAKSGAVEAADDLREPVSGTVKEISASVEKDYPATGEEYEGEEIVGQVRIINNYNKSQALVAKTRLLSPDNKLYRIKEAVNAPAGKEVTVAIYAEKPTEELAIGPTSFSIPGLWLGLQDKIYARSDQAFTFTKKVKHYVKQTDIENATKDIADSLVLNAKTEAGRAQDEDWLYDTSESAKILIGAKAGEVKDSFTVKATGTIIAVSFDREQAEKIAAAKLNLLIPDDKELVKFKTEEISYSLENYDPAAGIATIKESFSGVMSLKKDSELIDRQQLVSLNKEQIDNYLKNFPEILSYELKFSPAFIHKAPHLVDRISIKIDKD